ncbi:U6 snRNA-associated Sm-like protein LSm7 isoform X1 [Oxyura jamaicensis]|uniref:U6 snRNA-associated Sm-like protein LSm7 isoform X1 n=1 Tax=Oxyura jamaicensis TaxID=8884 RepID=UPI0015A4F7F0|nr:U6 snRNA-associated Sm-like protein LSm7 isoform X1 [Oxyura jamaicensis]
MANVGGGGGGGGGGAGKMAVRRGLRRPRGAPGSRSPRSAFVRSCLGDKEKKKKESILDLSKYIDKTIRVKFQGGREASGVLKGFDPLLNLVLDGTIEYMRDPDDQYKLTEDTRQLGLVVCRGTSVVLICPQDGMEAIPNPFIQQQDG